MSTIRRTEQGQISMTGIQEYNSIQVSMAA